MAPDNPMPTIEFFYDISCPFAYIASTRIEALAERTNAKLVWRPVLLGAIYRATNAPQGAAGSASDVFNPTKKAITAAAFQRTIRRNGIAYNEPPAHPIKTTAPLRLLYFVSESDRPALSKALFRAYWVEGKNVSDKTVLIDCVRSSGFEFGSDVIKAIEDGIFEGSKQREELERATDLAVQRGTPGVPAFWLSDAVWIDRAGRERKGRLFWGQDRMHFLEAVLLAMNENRSAGDIDKLSKPLLSLVPRNARNKSIPACEEIKLEFWHDFSSPWAFLGWTQLERLKRQFGPKLQIEMKPFLLGILFKEIGAPNLPMAAISEQKRKYFQQDHSDWVWWLNAINKQEGEPDKSIDFFWAEKFPIRTPTLLRSVLVEPKLVDVLYRACWERNLDMSSDNVCKQVVSEAGFDAENILAQSNSPEIKARLRQCTKEAKDIGICGVPSYRVFRRRVGEVDAKWEMSGDTVWGQDELNVVMDVIIGGTEAGYAVADVGNSGRSKI